MEPLISIITVCFNSGKTIDDTISSILVQDYKNYEYIIVDGQSKDDTIDIIKSYESKFSGKLKWISEKDHGIYDAMNKGIKMASGEVIGIINSDDWYIPGTLKKIVENYDKSIDIYYGNMFLIKDIDGKWYQKSVKSGNQERLVKDMVIAHPTCFVRRDWYNKFIFDSTLKVSADYKLMLESYLNHAKFKYIDAYFVYMRTHGVSAVPNYSTAKEIFNFRKKLIKPNYKNYFYLIIRLYYTFIGKIMNFVYTKFFKNRDNEGDMYLKRGWQLVEFSGK